MTVLIWILTWLPQVLAAMSELPRPVILTLNSSRFNHILKWKAGPGTPPGVHYRVTMSTTTWSSWVLVQGCEHVQGPLLCDLTHAFSDRTLVYLTQVTAVLEGQTSPPAIHPGFQPIRDTYLDPPLLSVTPCDANLCVDLQPPVEHLRDVYVSLRYQLRIQTNGVESVRDTMFLRRETLDLLAPGRESCVSVRFSGSLVRRRSNYSQPVCASIPANHHMDWLTGLLCLLVSFVLVAVVLLVATGYVCLRRKPLPSVLTSIHHFDRTVVLVPSCTALSFLLNIEPTAPSAGDTGSNRTLTEEDGAGETGSSGGREGGDNYTIKVDLNCLLPPSAFPLLSFHEPQPCSSSSSSSPPQTSDSVGSPPPSNETSHWETETDCQAPEPPADTFTGGGVEPDKVEEEEEVRDGGEEEVNLLTLTFGWNDDEEEEEEERSQDESSCASEDDVPVLPAPAWETEESGLGMFSGPAGEEENEEEEEENSGYLLHPVVFQN